MISMFGSSVGFLLPAAFFAAAAAGVALLFYAYLRKGKSNRVAVASTMFLKFLEGIPRSRQKFFPPWRFFLELLLLLLIAAALAGLYAESLSGKTAILLDNSASMQAIPDNSVLQEPLCSAALDKIKSELLTAAWGDKYNIYVSSPVLTSITDGYVSASAAKNRIEGLKASNFRDNLQAGIEKLIQNKDYNKLLVISDKQPDPSQFNSSVEWHGLKSASDKSAYTNIALSGVRIENDGLNSGGNKIEAVLQSYAGSAAAAGSLEGRLRLSSCRSFEACKNPEYISERQFALPLNSTVTLAFESQNPADVAYYLELKDLRRGGRSFKDSIEIDNYAWIASDAKKSKVLLVSDIPAQSLGLNLIPSLQVTDMTPSEYTAIQDRIEFKDYSSVLFHHFVPADLPDTNIIFVRPADNKYFSVEQDVNGVMVSRWKSGHEVLSYLNLSSLNFNILSPLKIPNVLEPLIYTPNGVAAFVGELNGKRMAAFGFEIFPYEGRRSPLLSVLTLNTFKWISAIAAESGFHRTDYPYAVTGDISLISGINGKEYYSKNNKQEQQRVYLGDTTLVRIDSTSAAPAFQAVRFYNPEESNTAEVSFVKIISADTQSSLNKKSDDTYTFYLTAAALLLLFADFLMQVFFSKNKFKKQLRQADGY